MASVAAGAGSRAGSERNDAATTLSLRNVYILPTRHGLAFCVVLLVTLIGATNYNNSLAFSLTFLLASMSLVSMLHTYRNLAGLRIQARGGDAVFAGANASFPITVDNAAGRERAGIVFVQGGTQADGSRARWSRKSRRTARTGAELHVPAEDRVQASLPVPTLRRGWLLPQRLQIETRAPLGLFRAWSNIRACAPVLVYPRPAGAQPMPAAGAVSERETPARTAGDEEFSGLRDYRFGDAPARIHWRAAARGGTPPVKQFDASLGDEVLFDYDHVAVGDREDRLCQLAVWIQTAHQQGLRYGLRLPGVDIAAQSGHGHLHRCLRALALFGVED